MIPADLQDLLEPLERFERLRRRASRLGGRLADLSYANPYGGVQERAREVLRDALETERLLDLQYSPFGGKTASRRAVADALRASHDLPFVFSDVVLTPGAMAALQLALRAVGEPGAEVVVPVPCWLDYPLYVRSLGMVPVPVPLAPETFRLDADALAGALSERTRAVLLCQPSNPTGRSHSAGELGDLAGALAEARERFGCEVALISDETHRDFVPQKSFRSPAAFWERTLLVYSFGKYHLMQGQRLGYVAVSPEHPDRESLAEELVRWTRVTGVATPTGVMQLAVPGLLSLRHDLDWLLRWRGRLLEALTDLGYDPVKADGTLFVYARTPRTDAAGTDDFEFAARLARAGLLVLPAPVFHHEGYFRLSLTGSEWMLGRALEVLEGFAP